MNLLNKCYDCSSSVIKYRSGEKNTKIRCQIYILIKKVIILRKIHMTMKSFAPPLFNHFRLSLNRKKTCNENYEKETKHIYASAADLLHMRIENLNWCKCGHCKNKTRKIDCLCCREVEVSFG